MPLLGEALPEFARELEGLLQEDGRPELAAQVPGLPVLDRCRCGQSYCALFDTVPGGARVTGEGPPETVKFETRPGTLILDVRGGRIRCIEALDRADVRDRLRAVLP